MCKRLGKYKCGHCEACLSEKRNDLAIRIVENYEGICRNFDPRYRAILFGMLTYRDECLPKSDITKDVVTPWQRPVQLFLKRLNRYYPWLRFEYYIAAEYSPSPNHRFHLHPVFMVTPRDYEPKIPKCWQKNYDEYLRVLSDDTPSYKVALLKSKTKERENVANFTPFEEYVRRIILKEWTLGLAELRPVNSRRAVIYVTKYMQKSRVNEFFRNRVYLSLDSQQKLKKYRVVDDPFFADYHRIGFDGNGHTIKIRTPRKRRQYYKDLYKSYLMSSHMGDAYYETPQFLELMRNFKIDLVPSDYSDELVPVIPRLRWFNSQHKGDQRGFPLPKKYRQHLYDLIAPKEDKNGIPNEYRLYIAAAGRNLLELTYLNCVVGLLTSAGRPYKLYNDHKQLDDLLVSNEDWQYIQSEFEKHYEDINNIKNYIYEAKNSNHEIPC